MRRPRQEKAYACRCGETDPAKFNKRVKGMCRACTSQFCKDRYKAMKDTEIPGAKCRDCGTTDGTKFYPSRSTLCKQCIVKETSERYRNGTLGNVERKPHIFDKQPGQGE